MNKNGIDVSYAQGKIDWSKVKAAGIEFAMIRSSYGKNKSQVDARFHENVTGCEAVGIPYGFYHYGYADTPARARAEAAFFLDVTKGYTPTYPSAYDVEDVTLSGLSRTALTDATAAFLKAIAQAGHRPMLYASASWLKNKLDMARLEPLCDVWCAQWSTKLTYGGKVDMWQSTDSGRVNGIVAAVDLNTCFTDYTAPAMVEPEPKMVPDNTPDGYAATAVEWAKQRGILRGNGRGDLMLHQSVTRQDLLVFLHRAMK